MLTARPWRFTPSSAHLLRSAAIPGLLLGGLVFLLLFAGCASGPVPSVGLSTTAFDFGDAIVTQTSTESVVTITNSTTVAATINTTLTGDPSLAIASQLSCGSTLAPGGACSEAVSFTPSTQAAVTGTLAVTLSTTQGIATSTVAITGTGVQLSSGQSMVTTTVNPVVARYLYQPQVAGTVAVQFGPTTSYGFITSSFAQPSTGGPVNILVAGMQQSTTYHLRAVVTAADGTVTYDQDHTFTTTSFPSSILPKIATTISPGMTPQPGIELDDASLSTTDPDFLEAYATDLSGNLIWGYNFTDRPTANTIVQPIKPLPDGNFLVTLSFAQQYLLPNQGVTLTPADQSVDLIREIDLAGDPVRQVTLDTLNTKLAAAGYKFTVSDIHHDVAILPNGHIILIAALLQQETGLTGYSGTTTVLGDVLIDLDTNFNVSWVWNEFDHLDVNRHPMNFPDWTHTNAVLYSPGDGNLLVSIRHQDWIVKVDYANGSGAGDILWKLGEGGDFTLINGVDPTDWFYAQHEPAFFSAATTGQFELSIMDNGDNRPLSGGVTCGTTGGPCYTTVPVLAIDEVQKTATVVSRQTIPSAQYSEYGGDTTFLANGNLEYDLCSDPFGTGSVVTETTVSSTPQTVWTMTVTGANLYRAHRIPSLYPGVQW
jgi:arylsulfate sulfotransferase